MMFGPAKTPCGSCPYRRDVPSGVWAAEEYIKLPDFDVETPFQPPRVFLCHQQNGRMCAGWCGCHDMDASLGLRLAASAERITVETYNEALDYETTVPLWSSGTEAAEQGMAAIEAPDDKAQRTIQRLIKKGRTA